MRCHGEDSALRGAVAVTVSTAVAEQARRASWNRRRMFTGLNLLGILVILAALLQYLVARPVKRIGEVADEVGKGNLEVTVTRADPDGDEISRLGSHINQMVHGLRTKMQLEKFVSRGTAEAAAGAGLQAISRTGERRAVTVLFSDIRGFTGYSERSEPEAVVEMLNRLLQAQAEVVGELGGDIDKFVGDELMAVFTGPDAELAAVRCAVRMLEAVAAARRSDETLGVGIGISAGDVVYGAIGHEQRMDFTVIGDVVNTGARLCSAAAAGEILVSELVYRAAAILAGDVEESAGIDFESGEPLVLKGKRDPFPVYRVASAVGSR
jgi:adenylate cyclase